MFVAPILHGDKQVR